MLKKVCAWCNITLSDAEDEKSNLVSHGICAKCFIKYLTENSTNIDQIINALPKPVFVINSEREVISANNTGEKICGKKIDNIRNQLAGDVFDCAHAKLPEGCGNTVHCKDCAIRNCILETYETGKPAIQKTITINKEIDGIEQSIHFIITTEKKGDAILLRIDEVIH